MSIQEPGQWTDDTGAEVDEFVDSPAAPTPDRGPARHDRRDDGPRTGGGDDGDSLPPGSGGHG